MDLVDIGLAFFNDKQWSVSVIDTGNQYYQIVTQDFVGYNNAVNVSQKIKSNLGWDGAIVKISDGVLEYTDYGMSLEAMLQLQMTKSNPQTDKYRNEPRYIHADFVDLQTQKVTGNRVNVRTGPSTSSTVTQQVNAGTSVLVIKKTGDWVEVRMTWQNAKESDVLPYLD